MTRLRKRGRHPIPSHLLDALQDCGPELDSLRRSIRPRLGEDRPSVAEYQRNIKFLMARVADMHPSKDVLLDWLFRAALDGGKVRHKREADR